jgi:AraC family transcriptional regulator of adaptative response/methylated-DNA-[protein]-cysteine methyltransferase
MAYLPFPLLEQEHAVPDGGTAGADAWGFAVEHYLGRLASKQAGGKPVVAGLIASPLGALVAAAVDDGVCLLEFADPARLAAQLLSLRVHFGGPIVEGDHPHLDRLRAELGDYFVGARRDFGVPLVYPGSRFQRAVWDRLRLIRYGTTLSYEALAREVGVPGAQRAVGRANGQNRISILIPCHRVVNKSGRLGGYGGGLWRKEWLLELERRGRTELKG